MSTAPSCAVPEIVGKLVFDGTTTLGTVAVVIVLTVDVVVAVVVGVVFVVAVVVVACVEADPIATEVASPAPTAKAIPNPLRSRPRRDRQRALRCLIVHLQSI